MSAVYGILWLLIATRVVTMYPLYSFALTIGLLLLLPRFLFQALRYGKYIPGVRERLGNVPSQLQHRSLIWLHSVSVGETQAARPLVKALREKFPHYKLVVSTTTLTGQKVAQDIYKEDAAAIIYFPFDWGWTIRRALQRVNPRAVLIMETEVWPNFLKECHTMAIPVAIVNGRLSERSFRRYRVIKRFIRRVLSNLELALMQTEADAQRILELGLAPEKVIVSGNLKFDAGTMLVSSKLTNELAARFSLDQKGPNVLAASTHAPEEQIILEAFKQIRAQVSEARLILAPRHPERFELVAALLKTTGLSWVRRSAAPSESDKTATIILLDSIGELSAMYPLTGLVFVGGSISTTGGHNVLEPAAFGCCIITGHHTYNFAEIVRTFVREGALFQLSDQSYSQVTNELERSLLRFLTNPDERDAKGKLAKAMLAKNTGATERTVRLLSAMLERQLPSNPSVRQVPIESAPLA